MAWSEVRGQHHLYKIENLNCENYMLYIEDVPVEGYVNINTARQVTFFTGSDCASRMYLTSSSRPINIIDMSQHFSIDDMVMLYYLAYNINLELYSTYESCDAMSKISTMQCENPIAIIQESKFRAKYYIGVQTVVALLTKFLYLSYKKSVVKIYSDRNRFDISPTIDLYFSDKLPQEIKLDITEKILPDENCIDIFKITYELFNIFQSEYMSGQIRWFPDKTPTVCIICPPQKDTPPIMHNHELRQLIAGVNHFINKANIFSHPYTPTSEQDFSNIAC